MVSAWWCGGLLLTQVLGGSPPAKPYGLAIHGGAGVINNLPAEKEKAYREALDKALQAGYGVLEKGGSSLDAVESAVSLMEDDPLFNAGKGAVLTWEGDVALDASIMDGNTLAAGAVAGVRNVKNPITLARLVMTKSPHVMLVGSGADAFARQQGLQPVDNASFITPQRFEAWQKAKAAAEKPDTKGTVGAVALDQQGNLAAATSTGGMMLKRWGRVGDSPLIGVGTYADNRTCAISCTGWGEFFIRNVVAHDIAAQMAYGKVPLAQAAKRTLDNVKAMGGDGGLIGLDAQGNVITPFHSPGMFRAWRKNTGEKQIKIYQD